ncbi:PREDICTED: coiled-coil domain-containing protein 92-like isoform X2 [Acropora digitifera]|uniref:coiled-coil domain-containing protein 92-like isoform X2 n=1 Tax=Acropora digitifera TaxID=70779 RepID=UPI00077B173C|nr:PREDICTED: coiled-coil domain-containing protein 92-like isoform X2 [Acropora digitifera]
MAGTLAQAHVQLQNAESSILFMQQEHAKTLQGLYAEINKLQKKCGELTFKLAMNATSANGDEAVVVQGSDPSQKMLNELRAENIELKGVIEVKNKKIVYLEGQLKMLDQKYTKDVSDKEANLSAVVRELEKKSDTIAYLTSQIHNSKLKQSGRQQPSRPSSNKKPKEISQQYKEETVERNDDSFQNISQSDAALLTLARAPMPPRDGTPSSIQRRYRRTVTSPAPKEVNLLPGKMKTSRAVGIQASPNDIQLNVAPVKSNKGMPVRPKRASSPPRPGLGISKLLQHSAGRDRPLRDDYVEFLKTGNRPDPQVAVRAVPEPLPPISVTERLVATPKTPYTGRMQMSRAHSSQAVPAAAIYAVASDGDNPSSLEDVGKIIVSPLSSPEKGWRHRQQPQQQNGPD